MQVGRERVVTLLYSTGAGRTGRPPLVFLRFRTPDKEGAVSKGGRARTHGGSTKFRSDVARLASAYREKVCEKYLPATLMHKVPCLPFRNELFDILVFQMSF